MPPEPCIGGGKIFVTTDRRNVSAWLEPRDLQNLPPGMGGQGAGVYRWPARRALDKSIRPILASCRSHAGEVPGQRTAQVCGTSSVHDAGTIINPKIVEGRFTGARCWNRRCHLREFVYDDEGQFLTAASWTIGPHSL